MVDATAYGIARYIGRKLYGALRSSAAAIDYFTANNFQDGSRDVADTYDIEVSRVDTNNFVRIGNSYVNPRRRPIFLPVPLNAKVQGAQVFFVSAGDLSLSNIFEVHGTLGTDAGAVTLTVTRDSPGTAPGGGPVVMTGTINLKGTINTVVSATLAATYQRTAAGVRGNSISLMNGDRLSMKITGTTTALAGLLLVAYAQPGMSDSSVMYSVVPNGDLATQYIYVANEPRTISSLQLSYSAKGTDAGAVTIDVTHETGTSAPGAGTTVLAAAITLKGTINTPQALPLTATVAQLTLAPGDRLSVKYTGTLTAVAGVALAAHFFPTAQDTMDISWALGPAGLQGTDLCFFIADRMYEVVDVSAVFGTANGAALTILPTIDTGTTAPGAGTGVATAISVNGTANTPVFGTMAIRSNRLMKKGDRLGLKHSTAVTSLANAAVTATIKAA